MTTPGLLRYYLVIIALCSFIMAYPLFFFFFFSLFGTSIFYYSCYYTRQLHLFTSLVIIYSFICLLISSRSITCSLIFHTNPCTSFKKFVSIICMSAASVVNEDLNTVQGNPYLVFITDDSHHVSVSEDNSLGMLEDSEDDLEFSLRYITLLFCLNIH